MPHASAVNIAQLNQLLSQAEFLRPFGFEVLSCSRGECVLRVPYHPSLERPGGVISGISIMAAADVAMWLAIMTLRGSEEHWVTTDLKTAFLRAAAPADFSCRARVLKLGRKTAYGSAECLDAAGELLAHHVVSYAQAPQRSTLPNG